MINDDDEGRTSRPLRRLKRAAEVGKSSIWAMIAAALAGSEVWAVTRRTAPRTRVSKKVAHFIMVVQGWGRKRGGGGE